MLVFIDVVVSKSIPSHGNSNSRLPVESDLSVRIPLGVEVSELGVVTQSEVADDDDDDVLGENSSRSLRKS